MQSAATKPETRSLPRDLEKLFEEHGRFVLRVAYRITGDTGAAEDILQSLFLRLLQSERLGDLELNPKGYLYRATVNIALDRIRRDRLVLSDQMEHHHSDGADPLREYQSAEIHSCFRAALSKLSPKASEIFVLKHLEGYDNHEIAQMLGTTRGTVAVTLFHSRAFLKKAMRRFFERSKGPAR